MERGRGFTLIELLMVVTIIAVIAVIAIPSLMQSRKHANEGSAIASLHELGGEQTLFREGDKEHDGNVDYGMLSELSNVGLLDSVLGAGTKQGYLFAATYGFASSEFLWYATASPVLHGQTGDRFFVTNNSGTIFYTGTGPVALDTSSCKIPATYSVAGK